MQTLWEHFKDGDFVILAVAADRGNKKGIARFVEKYKLTYPVPLDPDGTVRNTYEVVGLPMTYLIGKDGKISGRLLSSRDWSSAESITAIEHLLQQ
jgi:peroxiredoxin